MMISPKLPHQQHQTSPSLLLSARTHKSRKLCFLINTLWCVTASLSCYVGHVIFLKKIYTHRVPLFVLDTRTDCSVLFDPLPFWTFPCVVERTLEQMFFHKPSVTFVVMVIVVEMCHVNEHSRTCAQPAS